MDWIRRYWGKAKPDDQQSQDWHPLAYHMLDVAAVAAVVLKYDAVRLRVLGDALGFRDPQQARALLIFATLIHDLGKFLPGFQRLSLEHYQRLQQKDVIEGNRFKEKHDKLGYELLIDYFLDPLCASAQSQVEPCNKRNVKEFLQDLFVATTGHHGSPDVCIAEGLGEGDLPLADRQAAQAFWQAAINLLQPSFATWQEPADKAWTFLFNGFVTFCDWLGSNQHFFPYTAPEADFETYWQIAQGRAEIAYSRTGLKPAKPTLATGFQALFPKYTTPSPLQRKLSEIPLSKGPQLAIIEDQTGSGKTEAAIILLHRLLVMNLANGFYFALPTMATADQMYDRVAKAFAALFQSRNHLISLVLAQGQRQLNEKFTESLCMETAPLDRAYDETSETASAACTQWLADSAKRALLATVGVGTVDQAMFTVLTNKHYPLRLYGLAGKVLIIDEAHCYDTYMTTIIAKLIEIHTRYGGTTLLLSATMPSRVRKTLVAAYEEAMRIGFAQEIHTENPSQTPAYPCLWHYSADATIQRFHALKASAAREVAVKIHEVEPFDLILDLVKNHNKSVCWIRNTVDHAVTSYRKFEAHFDRQHLTLFHARFAMGDRLKIQADLLKRFGKDSSAAERNGQLVIATQVVEQSLDIDFDIVISDLAPMDLLLQRLGRQMRHCRDAIGNLAKVEGRGPMVFHIYAPTFVEEPDENWYATAFGNANFVYQDTGLLWLTQKLLLAKPVLNLPDDVRDLVEGAYDQDAVPPSLQAKQDDVAGKNYGSKSKAKFNLLDTKRGYTYTHVFDKHDRATSREGDNAITLRFFVQHEDGIRPYIEDEHAEYLSQLRINSYVSIKQHLSEEEDNQIATLAQHYRDKNRGIVPVLLHPLGEGFEGQYIKANQETVTCTYHCELGYALKDATHDH